MNQLAALLRDFAQGASNSAASNVTAPVDALAWLLRKGGLPIPEAPVGGSDWARQKGLTAEPQNKLAGLLGDAAGMAVPLAAIQNAPKIARGLLQMGDNLAAPATNNKQLGAIVYHGSPHQFNAFDSSKIGTGEGAQAYGHGLYFAEHPDVAKGYSMMADTDPTAQGYLKLFQGDKEKAAAKFSQDIAEGAYGTKVKPEMINNVMSSIQGRGQMYKVDLPDNAIAKMLDWDKPLSQQHPDVQKAAGDYLRVAPEWTGSQLYNDMVSHLGGQRTVNQGGVGGKVSERLREQGIPGIRYLDGGSRAGGAGTSNFVVFPGNEGLLKILERNGKPLP